VEGGEVVAAAAVPPGCHVRRRGEDVRAGAVLAPAGSPITLQALSALASAGVAQVDVHRRPRVRILVTGSELLPLGAPPEPGRIHESNGLALRRMSERAGAVVEAEDRVPDDAAATREAIAAALDVADTIVITGGVSVGPHDHVRPALQACGVQERFWRVRLRPGKPLWFGTRGATLVFGLPGNPLSAIVCFLSFVDPALRRLAGERDAALQTVPARLATPAAASDGRTTFLTSSLERGPDGVLQATPHEQQGSHLTGALAAADGFVVAPHDAGELPAGTLVDAVPLR
jgi:molybdopterin molybdotransferase